MSLLFDSSNDADNKGVIKPSTLLLSKQPMRRGPSIPRERETIDAVFGASRVRAT
jgi:hypothetical protein